MMVSDSGQTEHLCCCEVVNTYYALCIAADFLQVFTLANFSL